MQHDQFDRAVFLRPILFFKYIIQKNPIWKYQVYLRYNT